MRWRLLLSLASLAGCVDTGALHGFECDDGGRCVPPGQGGGATGGGSAAGGGGGEGERCQAGQCEALAPNGNACSGPGECASGFCVGGRCCNDVCSGACTTCSATGSEGHCATLPEGTAPAACGTLACDGVSGDCPARCASSRQCAPGNFCSGGTCSSLRDAGAGCSSNGECHTGFCADGVCCDQPCAGSCDRCNQAGALGRCTPAPNNDPGSPACGTTVVCNGTLSDCPILCGSGCPTGTWCSGTYCSAKRPAGTTCTAAQECLSGFCADGVCCNTACADACDVCSAAQGATSDGTCTLAGPSRLCRAAKSLCDVEERCTGTSAACPPDGFASPGTSCNTTSYSAWGGCDGGAACALSGSQSRARTDYQCAGDLTCAASDSLEWRSCSRPSDGLTCGTTTFGAWSSCTYGAVCDQSGTRTRARTDPVCSGGACSAVQSTETDTSGCARTTTGLSCASTSLGSWSSCGYAATCAESGSRTRSRTDAVCQAAACGSSTTTETDTVGCARVTAGQSCASTSYGAWSCGYASTCSTSGSRTRSVVTATCGSGNCKASTSTETETDTGVCGRTTTGAGCGSTVTGAWGACTWPDTCSTSGSRTRSVTTYACDSAGSCAASTTIETDTNCPRVTQGSSCGTTQNGAYTNCAYTDVCVNGGSHTRSVTTFTCNAGTCSSNTTTETDTAQCDRNTNNLVCVAQTCGTCSGCAVDCLNFKTCNVSVCLSGACTAQAHEVTCGSCSGCIPR